MIDFQFFFFLVNALIFNTTSELAIPTETPINEANYEIETHPVAAEIKTRKAVHSLNQYFLFLVKGNFLLHLFF